VSPLEADPRGVALHIFATRKGSRRNAELSDSMVSGCPYLGVRRSNPTYGASGTMFRGQAASRLFWTGGCRKVERE
jgi:hypothetical protein